MNSELIFSFYDQLKGIIVIVIVIGKIKCNCNLIIYIVIDINIIDPCLYSTIR